MRTIITAVFLIAMLSPSLGIAQVYYNQLGLYSDLSADVSATSIDMPASGFLHLYLIVTNPLNEDFIWRDIDGHLIGPYPREMTTISGFECKIILPPGYSLASFSLPVQNYGLESAGPENFKVSFYDPTPVPANKTVLLLSLTYIVESVGPNILGISHL